MKLFVYEHITSGAYTGETLPENLIHEGLQMWLSAIQDCHQTSACSIMTLHDSRITPPHIFAQHPHYQCHQIDDPTAYQQQWQRCLSECDAALIIAPETDNCLLKLQRQVEQAGKTNLGSTTEAIQITSDKLACAQHLLNADIATVPTYSVTHWQQQPFHSETGYIIKPIDGAGCTDTYHIKTQQSLTTHLDTLDSQQQKQVVIQPYLKGVNASLSIVASQQTTDVLSINQQHIDIEQNQLSLSACTVSSELPSLPTQKEAQLIAKQVHHAIPGLNGFFGIDLICDEDKFWIIDINPRLTSSYCALNKHFNLNPMQYLINGSESNKLSLSALSHQQHVTISL